ncbi:MAG TPA: AmmeMemoRadiSam system protein A [Pyrinomonadaceae bacterium]|nr:AmmeMemoRadiSam system protein A [Pyrinomonadaceae bacterium]
MSSETEMSGRSESAYDTESPVRADNSTAGEEDRLPELARRSVETLVREGRVLEVPNVSHDSLLGQRAACFVSIKTVEGDLRGCIGTVEPVRATLAEELIHNAISAATRDPRFLPIEISELSQLRYSVDVLSPPEPARFEELDPKIYGLIVEDERGRRRGLLLPDLEGVESAEQQLQIAARKAGIPPGADVKLYRFQVRRYGE